MQTELNLLILDENYSFDIAISYINIESNHKLFCKLRELKGAYPIKKICIDTVTNCRYIKTDGFGDTLKMVTIKSLMSLYDLAFSETSIRNKAAWSYLKELPSDLGVVLYWH